MEPIEDPSDVELAGAAIAVAFTGAVVAFTGYLLSLVAQTAGLAVMGVGLLVALASPIAWYRFRQLRT